MTAGRRARGAARLALLAGAVGVVLALAGCTTSAPRPGATVTGTRTVTGAPTTIVPVVPDPLALAAVDAPAQPPGRALPAGETAGSCPYIAAGLNIEPVAASVSNVADIEGNRVQRVAVLSTLTPVGCRFYFFSDYHPTGDILPSTYASPTEAHNAMVVTARAGTEEIGVPSFVPGVDGISFRTHLNAADNGQDWAFAFAKGDVMVVVRTDQTDTSANAKLLAQAIVGKF